MTERKPPKREPKTKAELYEMLAEAVRNTQPEVKRPPKAKKDRSQGIRQVTISTLSAFAAAASISCAASILF